MTRRLQTVAMTFEQYAREASGSELGELELSELDALRKIYKWGTGPKQILRLAGETFAQCVLRCERGFPAVRRCIRKPEHACTGDPPFPCEVCP